MREVKFDFSHKLFIIIQYWPGNHSIIIYSYPNAHLTQVEIEEITKRDQEKFENEKEKKIDKEIGSLRLRQKNETDALELKISIHLNKFNRERAMKTEEIMLKYKHKTK